MLTRNVERASVLMVVLMVGCGGRQGQPETPGDEVVVAVEEAAVEQASAGAQCPERVWDGDFEANDAATLSQLREYTVITGALHIAPPQEGRDHDIHLTTDVEDLPLDCLREVRGDLRIVLNDALASLDGLSNVTSIGGDLGIDGNDALASLDGLSSLTSVRGYVEISRNGALTSLDGLSSLTSVGSNLGIAGNDALTNLNGLSSLTSVG